jgi:hypothetical protein
MRTAYLKSARRLLALLVLPATAGLVACESGSRDDAGDNAAADSLAARASSVPAVELAAIAADQDQHQGQEIRIENASVDSRMGQRGFWVNLPNGGLYLVRGTAENAASVQPRTRVTVAGTVRPMSDSVAAAWIAQGAITADQEMEALYATSYLDAWYISGRQAAARAAE